MSAPLGLSAKRSSVARVAKPTASRTKAAQTLARPGTLPVKTLVNGIIAAWQEASVTTQAGGLRLLTRSANAGTMQRGQLLA